MALAGLLALVALWWRILHSHSGGRIWSPLWTAFSTTAAAILFLGTGLSGYGRTVEASARWSDAVVWREVGVGIALIPIALFLWRKGLRQADRQA